MIKAELVAIPEGAYVTAFYAQLATGSKAWYGEFDFEPLFVKNSAATVDTAESHNTIRIKRIRSTGKSLTNISITKSLYMRMVLSLIYMKNYSLRTN